jgi:hypothetical protein
MSILEKGENENERSQQKVLKKVHFKELVVFGSKIEVSLFNLFMF